MQKTCTRTDISFIYLENSSTTFYLSFSHHIIIYQNFIHFLIVKSSHRLFTPTPTNKEGTKLKLFQLKFRATKYEYGCKQGEMKSEGGR